MNPSLLKSPGLPWGVTWRMTAWGLLGGVLVGVVFGPISMLVLVVLGRLVEPARFADATSDAMVPALIAGGIIGGLLYGALIGLLSGLAAGLVLGMLLRYGPSDAHGLRSPAAISGAICGLLTLALTASAGLATYLTPRWPLVGLVLWVVAPAALAVIAGWWVAGRAVESLEDRGRAWKDLN